MRVKLRPDAHCAPVPRGVYWVRGDRSFVLSGPPALYEVIDFHLDALLNGTSVDEIVAASGNESARPVVEHVVRTLVAEDVLIDLDAVHGPLPDPETARAHFEVLSYLESNCAEPYLAFAAVRAARVAVVGEGPAAEAALRGLAGNGIGEVIERQSCPGAADLAGSTLVVWVDDHDHEVDLLAAVASVPQGTPILPVAAEADFALIGPVCADPRELRAFQESRTRAGSWVRSGAESPAPRPISAVLAGSLAAQTVLAHLAGTAEGHAAQVVHGHAVETRVVPLAAADLPVESRWRDLDIEQALAGLTLSPADQAPTAPVPGNSADGADAQEVHRLAATLTTRWTGIARWGRDLDLPQLPVCLVTAEYLADHGRRSPETATGPYFLGWGHNRAAAGLTAVLAALRRHSAGERDGEGGDGSAAAGRTEAHLLADGLLRRAGLDALTRDSGTPFTWEQATNPAVRSQLSILRDFFDTPVELRMRDVPGLDWRLAAVTHRITGETLACEWGPSEGSAAYAALLSATGRAQFRVAEKTAPQPQVLPPDPVGTWSLEIAPDRQVRECLRQLLGWARVSELRPHVHRLTHDEVVGELPLACGWVALG